MKRNPNLTDYTRQQVESRLLDWYGSWFGDKNQTVLQIFENTYLKNGTADDDHLAWLQFEVDVRISFLFNNVHFRSALLLTSVGEHFETFNII